MAIAAYRLLRERFGIETTMSAIVPVASGFSGAAVFRVQHCEEELCLRCWPRQTSAERVQWVHRRLEQFHENGERRLAIPLPSLRGSTVVSRGPEVWELAPWMDGIADFENRQSSQRLKAAMQVLAQLHDIAERFRVRNDLPVPSCRKLSKGIQTRLQGLERTLAGRLDKISAAVATTALDENSEVIQA